MLLKIKSLRLNISCQTEYDYIEYGILLKTAKSLPQGGNNCGFCIILRFYINDVMHSFWGLSFFSVQKWLL